MAAHATANNVIASANRLIDVRHVCFNSRRIAEMSVPAWPMPIHQTKLVMSNAHPTGMSLPQIPMPLTVRYVSDTSSHTEKRNAVAKPAYQPNGVRRARTIALMLSVTDPNVYPGAMTGGTPDPTTACIGSSIGGIDWSIAAQSPSSGFMFRIAAR